VPGVHIELWQLGPSARSPSTVVLLKTTAGGGTRRRSCLLAMGSEAQLQGEMEAARAAQGISCSCPRGGRRSRGGASGEAHTRSCSVLLPNMNMRPEGEGVSEPFTQKEG